MSRAKNSSRPQPPAAFQWASIWCRKCALCHIYFTCIPELIQDMWRPVVLVDIDAHIDTNTFIYADLFSNRAALGTL